MSLQEIQVVLYTRDLTRPNQRTSYPAHTCWHLFPKRFSPTGTREVSGRNTVSNQLQVKAVNSTKPHEPSTLGA